MKNNSYSKLPECANLVQLGLVDPRSESFEPWPTYIRKLSGQILWTSKFLYSPYQILIFPYLQSLIPKMEARKTPRKYSNFDISYSLTLTDKSKTFYKKIVAELDDLVIVLSALETKYRPRITGRLTNHREPELEPLFKYDQTYDPSAMLRWIGWDTTRIQKTAERLLSVADSLDLLKDWTELVRL